MNISPKTLILVFLVIIFGSPGVFARAITNSKTGMLYLASYDLKLVTKKKSDQQEANFTAPHAGIAFEYETQEGRLFSYFGRIGIMDRNSNSKLYSGDIRKTVVNEQVILMEIGFRSSLGVKKTWLGFYPFAGFNLSYFSLSSTLQNVKFNESGLTDEADFPSIDSSISTSLISPSITFGLNYNFRFAGIRLLMNIYPENMTSGGKLDDNYDFAYKMNGYIFGIGFVAFF